MAYVNVRNSGKLSTNTAAGLTWTPGGGPAQNNLLTGRFFGCGGGAGYAPVSTDVKDSTGTPKLFNQDVVAPQQGAQNDAAIYSLVVPSGLTTPLKNVNTTAVLEGIFDEWSGNATTSVLDQTNSHLVATNATTTNTGTINTGANAGLILAALYMGDPTDGTGLTTTGTSFTANAVETQDLTFGLGNGGGSCDSRTASCASQSGLQDVWTWTNAQPSTACIASYKVPPNPYIPSPDPIFVQRRL